VRAISEVDDAITRDIVGLFPAGPKYPPSELVGAGLGGLVPQIRQIEELSDDQIDAIVNDMESGGVNNAKVLRGLRGSTALVSLVDPSGENLWVASLGDCQAGSFYFSFVLHAFADFVIISKISAWHKGRMR
jgi:pyruvate dehydrogenase phosphatase